MITALFFSSLVSTFHSIFSQPFPIPHVAVLSKYLLANRFNYASSVYGAANLLYLQYFK